MRALQPPFLGLMERFVRSGSASINSERLSAKFMIFTGCCFMVMGGISFAFSSRMRGFGIAYAALGILNVLVSIRRLQNLKKRLGDNV